MHKVGNVQCLRKIPCCATRPHSEKCFFCRTCLRLSL
uniref:Uncharacterized protein n=1 Tax=Anguilla anguilla TaxID=7936 RepID=A0A0E9TDZ7_ANGAN